jgi:hypothetical protein
MPNTTANTVQSRCQLACLLISACRRQRV